mmetsp:Transcript_3488/g.7194  ORF Transcript_3488/g.7194 Transcript_3488/m.7194 type:complete len:243 (+) Transcript_3488:977-1705(+)
MLALAVFSSDSFFSFLSFCCVRARMARENSRVSSIENEMPDDFFVSTFSTEVDLTASATASAPFGDTLFIFLRRFNLLAFANAAFKKESSGSSSIILVSSFFSATLTALNALLVRSFPFSIALSKLVRFVCCNRGLMLSAFTELNPNCSCSSSSSRSPTLRRFCRLDDWSASAVLSSFDNKLPADVFSSILVGTSLAPSSSSSSYSVRRRFFFSFLCFFFFLNFASFFFFFCFNSSSSSFVM